jgi:ergothioneine biosynthesis protein EgtB
MNDAERATGGATGGATAAMRKAGRSALTQALQDSRRDTLALFSLYRSALAEPGLAVPYAVELNPPLWELGHIGWFQSWWLARNPQRARGVAADPMSPRMAAARADADTLYDSSRVVHASRWQLPLPDARATLADLEAGLAETLALLPDCAEDDTGLYFARLCLAHEDMHHEAALYMAQALGLAVHDERWQPLPLPESATPIALPAGRWTLGSTPADGFAFDNELGAHEVALPACHMDSQVLRWCDYLPFVAAGAYEDSRWWPAAAAPWRAARPSPAPRYLRRAGVAWEQWRHGAWQALDLSLPACHLNAYEAQAWCAWAGRRLPSEAEWERAALQCPESFQWGQVWEWTASVFEPYPGFASHPYRDYSAPWFGSRPVLRGASFTTQPRMRHARYRNYFTAERNDIFAGFRSCAK